MLKVVLFLLLVSAAIYFLVRIVDSRGKGGSPQRPVVGPDDDPDFLSWLDRKRKRDQGK